MVRWYPILSIQDKKTLVWSNVTDNIHKAVMDITLKDKIDMAKVEIWNKNGDFSSSFPTDSIVELCIINTNPTGLVGYWQFGDDLESETDTTTKDRSGYRHDGTVTGSKTDGKFGKGLNGATVSITSTSNLNPTEKITVSAWIKFSSATGNVVLKDSQYRLNIASGQVKFSVFIGSWKDSPLSSVLSDGSWHHILGTYDGSTIRLYVDGVEVGSGTSQTGNIGTSSNALSLGLSGVTTDDVRIYNRALGSGEVTTLNTMVYPRSELTLGGFVQKREIKPKRGWNKTSILALELTGWAVRLMDRIVQGQIISEGKTIDEVIKSILTVYISDFDQSQIQGSTTVVPPMTLDMRPVMDVIKFLSSLEKNDEFDWYITADKKFRYFKRATNTTTVVYEESAKEIFDFAFAEDGSKLADRVIVVGGVADDIDKSQTSIPNTKTTNTKHYAFKFTPTQPDLTAINMPIQKVGSPISDLRFKVVEDSGGSPTSDDTKIRVRQAIIQADTIPTVAPVDTDDFLMLILDDPRLDVEIGTTLWVVIEKNGDASNHYKLFGDSGITSNGKQSDDGITWSEATFAFAFETASKRNVRSIAVSDSESDRHREITFIEPAIKSQAGARTAGSSRLKRYNEGFTQVQIQVRPPTGTWLRVGDGITVDAPTFGVTEKDFIIHEISWDFKPQRSATFFKLQLAASEEPEEIGDVIEQMMRDLRDLEFRQLASQSAGSIDVPLVVTENGLLDDIGTEEIPLTLISIPATFDPPLLDDASRLATVGSIVEDDIESSPFGNAMHLKNVDSQVIVDHSTPFNVNDHTLSFSVKLDELPATSAMVVSKGAGAPMIYVKSNGNIVFKKLKSGGEDTLESNTPLTVNAWTRVHCWFDASVGMRIYRGQHIDNSNASTTTMSTNSNQLIIGSSNSLRSIKGYVEDIFMFNSGLNTTQLQISDKHEKMPEALMAFYFKEGYGEQATPLKLRAQPFDLGVTQFDD